MEINDAFWQACHGGQRRTAAYLLAHGADLNWIPDYAKDSALAVAAAPATRWDMLISWLRAQGAKAG